MNVTREKIKLIMKIQGYSQDRLSKEIGMSRVAMNRFLCGVNDMNSVKVFKMLDILNIVNLDTVLDTAVHKLSNSVQFNTNNPAVLSEGA